MRSSSPTTMPSIERVVDRVLLHLHLGRDRALGRLAVDVVHRVVVEQLDDAAEVGFVADGELQRRDAGAELVLELVERARERRPLAVELVDEDRARAARARSAMRHTISVCTSTPSTADTTNTARSAARNAAATSLTKSA